jgi:hypothetical protein
MLHFKSVTYSFYASETRQVQNYIILLIFLKRYNFSLNFEVYCVNLTKKKKTYNMETDFQQPFKGSYQKPTKLRVMLTAL